MTDNDIFEEAKTGVFRQFMGPFDDQDDAIKYCQTDPQISDGNWNVVLLQEPAWVKPMYDLEEMNKKEFL